MEQLKHECGIVVIRLRKPLDYYKQKYGSYAYGLGKLYLMMEKQHNRGQEAAGVGVVKLQAPAGYEYVFRERALGTTAIQEIFGNIHSKMHAAEVENMNADEAAQFAPFIGEIYMGHLRYSTTGKGGMSYVHPFLRRNNWRSRNLMLCGNFNMTNVDSIFQSVIKRGQHPRLYSDTIMLLEQLGYALDHENHRVYRELRNRLEEPELTRAIEQRIDMHRVLADCVGSWDGGYVICGATGSGDVFVQRDPHGIRPAWYYIDDEIVVVTSERPVIQTALNVPRADVHELEPGAALILTPEGDPQIVQVMEQGKNQRCSFERIYFSRGSDADIYRERKALGRNLVPDILQATGPDLSKIVLSFIPNTAEVAFIGMVEGLEQHLDRIRADEIESAMANGTLTRNRVEEIMSRKLRVEKVAIKDIKLRTFIAEGEVRNDLAAHVYDVTYGCIHNNEDTLVVIDDSIVRGTTLKQSILRILDRLHPKKIVVVSSSPQVRYPDYYGIDMSRMGEFIAFRAAVSLLKRSGMQDILHQTYRHCLAQKDVPDSELVNCVKAVYEPFSDREISAEIARLLTPADMHAQVEIVYQTLKGMHEAIPDSPGDWYFSGNYPTPGGIRLVNQAYINFYEGHADKR